MRPFGLCLSLGHLWGRLVLQHGVTWLRLRAQRFDLTVLGLEHLQALGSRGYLIVSNHIQPHDSPMGPLARVRFLRNYQYSADSFIFHRVLREHAARSLTTIAQCDRGTLSPHPWKRLLQHRLGQPFAIGQLEALSGYIPVEHRPSASQRRFLMAVVRAVQRQDAILIFPGPIPLEKGVALPELEPGAAHIARRFGLPILPACILGSDSWRSGQSVTVMFGKPFSAAELTKAEIGAEIQRRVRALHVG